MFNHVGDGGQREFGEKCLLIALDRLGRKAKLPGGLDHAVGIRALFIRSGDLPDFCNRLLQAVLFGNRRQTGRPAVGDVVLFDAVVFDDSIKEFLSLKKKLADYFDEIQTMHSIKLEKPGNFVSPVRFQYHYLTSSEPDLTSLEY